MKEADQSPRFIMCAAAVAATADKITPSSFAQPTVVRLPYSKFYLFIHLFVILLCSYIANTQADIDRSVARLPMAARSA